MIVPPREDRIMVRVIFLGNSDEEPRVEPLARLGLTALDIEYIIKKWDADEDAVIGHFRYERIHE